MKGLSGQSIIGFMFTAGLGPAILPAVAAEVPPGVVLAAKQDIVRNNGSEPASLDPHKVESDVEFNIISDFFEGLVSIDNDGTVRPRLAARWENRNNTVWTFHLRPGLTWSNGDPLTARDLVFSWRRLADPKTASPYESYLANMHVLNAGQIIAGKKAADTLGIQALDDRTVQITLEQPIAYFLQMLAHPSLVPIYQKAVERYQDKWTQPGNFVSNGPFTLSQWVVNERLVGVRNPRYWDNGHTVINKVTYLPISSDTAAVNRYKAGEIDITNTIPQTLFRSLQRELGNQVHISPKLATYYYEFNTRKTPFNDVRVRLALNLGLDKDIIADKVLGQGQIPAWLISQEKIGGVALRKPDYAGWPREKRLAEAKRLLAAAGYDAAHPLTFDILYNTSESHQRIAIAASSMWRKNLGVVARLRNQEWKTMLDTMHTGQFDVVRYAWVADYDDASTFLNNFRSGDSENTSMYSNADYDQALKLAARAATATERGMEYQRAEDLLARDVPAIPVYHYVAVNLVKPYIGGFNPSPLAFFYTRDLYVIQH